MGREYENKGAIEMFQKVTSCSEGTAKRKVNDFIRGAEEILSDPNTEYVPLEEVIRQIG